MIALIETTAYQESPQDDCAFLSRRLGLDDDAVEQCIRQLSQLGLIERTRKRSKWRTARAVTVDAAGEARSFLREHWAAVSARRVSKHRNDDLFSYNVFAVSVADLERIRALQRAYFREIRAIVSASEPSETAALVTMHLMEWSAP